MERGQPPSQTPPPGEGTPPSQTPPPSVFVTPRLYVSSLDAFGVSLPPSQNSGSAIVAYVYHVVTDFYEMFLFVHLMQIVSLPASGRDLPLTENEDLGRMKP